jgi:N-acyl-D-amino-acid deacylase
VLDIVIQDGLILDGTGNPGFTGDVGIQADRIEIVEPAGGLSGQRFIEANGLVVAPGFIDTHNHFDTILLINPAEDGELRQGVTTGCIGNCGISLAPVKKRFLSVLQKYTSPLHVGSSLSWEWETMGQYLDRIDTPCMNVAALVGHGTVRIATMGMDNRSPSSREMDEMKSLILEAMDQGAIGLSSGLIYPPGIFAETDELAKLCKAVAKRGGIYSTHIRGESDTLVEAVAEAIRIGEESGVSLLISHHKAGGRKNWGKVNESLALVEKARARGLDVHLDQYPYTAGSTMLGVILPPWMKEKEPQVAEQLRDPEVRRRIKDDIETGIDGWENFVDIAGWEGIVLAFCKNEKELEGKSILEIAEERNQEPAETAFDVLMEEEGDVIAVIHAMSEEDVRTVMKHPLVIFGTDGIPSPGKPHPRLYGTYPRILGKYVRDEGVLSLEEAIRKMTSLPAQKLRLTDRGTIAKGGIADLVLFNPSTIREKSTYSEPDQRPDGIEYVLVNGSIAIEQDKLVNAQKGEILKK